MRRGSTFATALAAVFLLSAPAAHACVSPRTVPLDRGPTLRGEEWEVSASIRKNGTCRGGWLFSVNFSLPQISNWGSATGIPVGGHISRYFDISASDEVSLDGTERAFSGYTGREVATIAMTMNDGQRTEVHPKFPPGKLRKHFVWLRSFRYFVRYHPPDSAVASVSLFNKAGILLYRASAEEGFF